MGLKGIVVFVQAIWASDFALETLELANFRSISSVFGEKSSFWALVQFLAGFRKAVQLTPRHPLKRDLGSNKFSVSPHCCLGVKAEAKDQTHDETLFFVGLWP